MDGAYDEMIDTEIISSKTCIKCGTEKPIADFYLRYGNITRGECRTCSSIAKKHRNHVNGKHHPYYELKESPLYLGVYIGERVLSDVFHNVTRMPMNNPGYDFICGNGYKIDVKTSCTTYAHSKYPYWYFKISNNKTADYFACIAFDNRTDLNPLHFWLIPSNVVCCKQSLLIYNTTIGRLEQYEKPVDKIIRGCNTMRCKKCL
jgi:hypothetical protein